MIIQKKVSKKSAVKASNSRLNRRRAIKANEEIEEPEVDVAPEASDLLFEAEDVAELIAEITDEEVAVTAEGDEEILESSTRVNNKKAVKASRKVVRKNRSRR